MITYFWEIDTINQKPYNKANSADEKSRAAD